MLVVTLPKQLRAKKNKGSKVLVVNQSGAFHVFARLFEAKHKVKNEEVVIDRTLPPFQALESS